MTISPKSRASPPWPQRCSSCWPSPASSTRQTVGTGSGAVSKSNEWRKGSDSYPKKNITTKSLRISGLEGHWIFVCYNVGCCICLPLGILRGYRVSNPVGALCLELGDCTEFLCEKLEMYGFP